MAMFFVGLCFSADTLAFPFAVLQKLMHFLKPCSACMIVSAQDITKRKKFDEDWPAGDAGEISCQCDLFNALCFIAE
jgi:hypothetical protein